MASPSSVTVGKPTVHPLADPGLQRMPDRAPLLTSMMVEVERTLTSVGASGFQGHVVRERAGEMNARKEREEGLGGQWRERRG
eukprot:786619-Rhodomonas_salina.1